VGHHHQVARQDHGQAQADRDHLEHERSIAGVEILGEGVALAGELRGHVGRELARGLVLLAVDQIAEHAGDHRRHQRHRQHVAELQALV
jgi:hypothetical protein